MSYSNMASTINTMKTQTNAVNYANNKAKGNDTVDQDIFLQLMVTQLQNQDPLSPMDNTEFLSQQAQFSQVTAMQDMNEKLTKYGDMLTNSLGLNQSMNMVGKQVTLADVPSPTETDPNHTETITGIVDAVKVTSDGIMYTVNGQDISSQYLQSINNPTASQGSGTTTNEENSLKETAKDFLKEILNNPKLKSAATNLIEKLAGNLI